MYVDIKVDTRYYVIKFDPNLVHDGYVFKPNLVKYSYDKAEKFSMQSMVEYSPTCTCTNEV